MDNSRRNPLVEAEPMPVRNDLPAMWPQVMADVDILTTNDFTDADGDLIPARVAVLVDMRDRDRVGLERYGTQLQPFNGRDNLVDAYQELLDACVYLRTAIYEEHENTGEMPEELRRLYAATLHSVVMMRSLIWRRDGQ